VTRALPVSERSLGINEQEVGPDLVADFGRLEAILRSQQTVFGDDAYPDIHTKTAAMMHSLIRDHPFLDGNKRTAVLPVILFYNLNGYAMRPIETKPSQLQSTWPKNRSMSK
jgi:death-on-curing protein